MDKQQNNRVTASKNSLIPVSENSGLMDFLMKQMPQKSRNNIKSLLGNRQVLVDGQIISQFNHPLVPGQKIEIKTGRIPEEKEFPGYTIVYEDHDLIVIDKKAGLLSIATETEKRATAYSMLSDHVKNQDKSNKIFIVHRLDRETSGLMLFAKSDMVKHHLQETWNDTIIERSYIAVVEGMVGKTEGVISSYLYEDNNFKMHSSPYAGNGLKSVTHYTVLKRNDRYSLLKVNLETGRKNQIRIHMQEIGHSIVGDKKYGATTSPIKRLGLHAQQLSFVHPSTGKKLNFEIAIPKEFLKLF